jgi:hypothetical protein
VRYIMYRQESMFLQKTSVGMPNSSREFGAVIVFANKPRKLSSILAGGSQLCCEIVG